MMLFVYGCEEWTTWIGFWLWIRLIRLTGNHLLRKIFCSEWLVLGRTVCKILRRTTVYHSAFFGDQKTQKVLRFALGRELGTYPWNEHCIIPVMLLTLVQIWSLILPVLLVFVLFVSVRSLLQNFGQVFKLRVRDRLNLIMLLLIRSIVLEQSRVL